MNRTIVRAFEILDFVASLPNGASLTEISDHLDLSKSSAHVIVQTLLGLNYLECSAYNERKYILGIAPYTLGMKYLGRQSFLQSGSKELDSISEKYGKTGFIGVLNGQSVLYVYKHVPAKSIISSCALGSEKPANSTALGKVLIAFSHDSDAIIDSLDFKSITDLTITDKESFRREIEKVKIQGYALDRKESDAVLMCTAAPIFDNTGYPVAAMSLTELYNPNEDSEIIAQALIESCRRVSRSLGYIRR